MIKYIRKQAGGISEELSDKQVGEMADDIFHREDANHDNLISFIEFSGPKHHDEL